MDLQEQYEKLLRYCLMLTGNRELAEDVVQETYLRFWKAKDYRDTGKELAYLTVIARNLCMDEFRRPRTEDLEDCGELPADPAREPEAQIDRLAVEDALARLPGDLRELLVLRYVEELSVTDIGKVLGLSRFAVHRRLKEGLAQMKELLGGDPDEE